MGVNSISRDHPIANAKQVRFLAELLESPTSVQQPNISATAKQSLDGRQQSFAIFFWRNSAAKKIKESVVGNPSRAFAFSRGSSDGLKRLVSTPYTGSTSVLP